MRATTAEDVPAAAFIEAEEVGPQRARRLRRMAPGGPSLAVGDVVGLVRP